MTDTLAPVVERFLAHRRALGRRYDSEEAELRLLVRFADERCVRRLDELTPVLLDDFLASRPRPRPRSFNHLLGVVACWLDWAVAQVRRARPATPRRRVRLARSTKAVVTRPLSPSPRRVVRNARQRPQQRRGMTRVRRRRR